MKLPALVTRFFREGVLLAGLLAPAALTRAANIFWTGPVITFTHPANASTADELTTNHIGADATNNVWLTRGLSQPLYNAAAESSWDASISPANTLWAPASGDLTNADALTYDVFANVVGQPGNSPGNSVGQTFYVKIISDNIYLSLKLTAWGSANGGSFAYDRSTPAGAVPPAPAITIINPAGNAVFAAPANVGIATAATVSSGAVTNVQFFTNGVSLGSRPAAPFNLTAANLGAGAYALTAVATAAGISATSAVVNVTVVNPVAVVISGAEVRSNQFSFNYTANPGLAYVVQSSSDLAGWTSLVTNVASGNPAGFSGAFNQTGIRFYRVGRLPNP